MTPGLKDNHSDDLPALVSQLQELADEIRRQVDRELARIDQARSQAASESARLEALLAKTKSAFPPDRQQTTNPLPEPPSHANTPQTQPNSDTIQKHQEIYSLCDQGVEPLQIAQRTARTLGEVQLILALRKSE